MTKFFLIASAALAAVTSPALARDAKPADTATTEASQPAASTPRARDTKTYCVVDTLSGSRIARKVCKTREAWMQQGFDPLAQ